jgi:hypothetical protein
MPAIIKLLGDTWEIKLLVAYMKELNDDDAELLLCDERINKYTTSKAKARVAVRAQRKTVEERQWVAETTKGKRAKARIERKDQSNAQGHRRTALFAEEQKKGTIKDRSLAGATVATLQAIARGIARGTSRRRASTQGGNQRPKKKDKKVKVEEDDEVEEVGESKEEKKEPKVRKARESERARDRNARWNAGDQTGSKQCNICRRIFAAATSIPTHQKSSACKPISSPVLK